MFNPEFLLAHIRMDTKFDANLLEQIIREWKEYRATGLTPEDVNVLLIIHGLPAAEIVRIIKIYQADQTTTHGGGLHDD